MNELQLLRWHNGLVALSERGGHMLHVTYLHDPHCPCAGGVGAALPDCNCEPYAEVDGAMYKMDNTGHLRVVERR